MALIDKASLLMVPSTYEAGKLYNVLPSGNRAPDNKGGAGYDQTRADFDFDRGSNTAATRIGSDGLIKKYRENLLLNSNQFDTTWTQSNTTLTSGQSGYNGNNAWKVASASGGQTGMQQDISFSNIHTFSIYAKAGSVDFLKLFVVQSGTNRNCIIDLSDGSIASEVKANSSPEASVTSLANGWYRIEMPTNANSATFVRIRPHLAVSDENLSVGDFIYIQDSQLETGLVATDVLTSGATTGKAGVLVDLPRINYDANGENGALLLEPSRANLVPITEGVPEDTNNVTLTENYGISPEGFQNSLKGQKNGVDANDRIQPIDNYNATLVSGNDYTISCFVKNIDSINGVTTLACRVSGGSLFRSGYDWDGSSLSYLTTGYNAGTRENIFVEDYGNGWWRIGFTFEADGTSGNFELDIDRRNGSNTTSIETYGWQLEAGSYASSYIPNHGESGGVTRAADSCSVTGASDVIGQTEGTMFVEFTIPETQGPSFFSISDGTYANRIIFGYTAGTLRYYVNSSTGGFSVSRTIDSSPVVGQTYKIALAYKNNDFKAYKNGTNTNTETTFTVPASLTAIDNQGGGVGQFIFAEVNQFILFKERLSNAELATLTTL